jgi:hypothetical protein
MCFRTLTNYSSQRAKGTRDVTKNSISKAVAHRQFYTGATRLS